MILDSFNDLNWAAVGAATSAAFAIGFVWFAPPVLGGLWARQVARYARISEAEVTSGASRGAPLAKWLVGMAINAIVLALAVEEVGADSLGDGVVLGVALWFGSGRR